MSKLMKSQKIKIVLEDYPSTIKLEKLKDKYKNAIFILPNGKEVLNERFNKKNA